MTLQQVTAAVLAGAACVLLFHGPPAQPVPQWGATDAEGEGESQRVDETAPLPETSQVSLPAGWPLPHDTSDTPRKVRLSACLNDDAYVEFKISIWTMVIDTKKGYVESAARMLKSAKRRSEVRFSAMVLELKEKPIEESKKEMLREAGWGICTVNRIPPPDEEATFKHFRDQFTKFALWRMTELDTALYLDSDTYVLGDISGLLTTQLGSKKIGVGRDYLKGVWRPTFNMGVFLIHPNKADYELLMTYYRGEKPLDYNKHWSEQAFLNALWANEWHDIGFEHNANLAVAEGEPAFWKERQGNIRILHYTAIKPWKGCHKTEYWEICKWWIEER